MASSSIDAFRRMVDAKTSGLEGSVELLASQLSSVTANLMRLAALPHRIDKNIVSVLIPQCSLAERIGAIEELMSLSFMFESGEGIQMHDDVRKYLFDGWLNSRTNDEGKWAQFISTSARLVDYFSDGSMSVNGHTKVLLDREKMFHMIGAEVNSGFDYFEHLCRQERYSFRLSSCESIIMLAKEYALIMSDQQQLWLRYHEGKLLADLRNFDDAKEVFRRLVVDATTVDDISLRTRSLLRQAMVMRETGELEAARDTFTEVQEIVDNNVHEQRTFVRARQGLASTLMDLRKYTEAEVILNEVLAHGLQTGDYATLAVTWNLVGNLRRKLGQLEQAVTAFQGALGVLKDRGEYYRTQQVYNNIGLVYLELAEWDKARVALEKSVSIGREVGDINGEATASSNLIRVYLAFGELENAIAAGERAIALFLQIRNWKDAAITSRTIGHFERKSGRIEAARIALIRASDFFEKDHQIELARDCLKEIEELEKSPTFWRKFWSKVATFAVSSIGFVMLLLVGMMLILALGGLLIIWNDWSLVPQ